MVKKYETVAVVVTYNRKELLHECLEALTNLEHRPELGILIVDNHSTDGTKDYVKKFLNLPNVHYVDTGENLGGAGGFNYGIKEAYKMAKKYVWVMDDDCIVQPNSLSALLEFAKSKNDEFGFLSSKVLWKDSKIHRMNVQRKTMYIPLSDLNSVSEITLASFVSMFINKSAIKQLGLPIKDFFIWSDDWEYARRISRKFKCFFVPKSVVIHKSKNNIACNIITEDSERYSRYKYIYRNDMYIYRREGFSGYMYVFLRNSYNFACIMLKSKTKKLEKIKLIIKSTHEGLSFTPPIEFPDD